MGVGLGLDVIGGRVAGAGTEDDPSVVSLARFSAGYSDVLVPLPCPLVGVRVPADAGVHAFGEGECAGLNSI